MDVGMGNGPSPLEGPGDLRAAGYELVCRLGEGGMGEVWAAARFGVEGAIKPCAIKVIRPALAGDEQYRRMFVAEGRVAMMLGHANIVSVFDVGVVDGLLFMAMDWVDGIDLGSFRQQAQQAAGGRALAVEDAAHVVGALLDALGYAHGFCIAGREHGIVHRDVSPGNVMITSRGEVKLMDFGLAGLDRSRREGTVSRFRGTLRYLSREQARGRPEPASDLFAVGAILHELLDGRKFRHWCETDDALVAEIFEGGIPPLERRVPAAIETLRRGLLEPRAELRIKTAQRALATLSEWPGYRNRRQQLESRYRQVIGGSRSGLTQLLSLEAPGDALDELRRRVAAGRIAVPPVLDEVRPTRRKAERVTPREALRTVPHPAARDGSGTAAPLDGAVVHARPPERASAHPAARAEATTDEPPTERFGGLVLGLGLALTCTPSCKEAPPEVSDCSAPSTTADGASGCMAEVTGTDATAGSDETAGPDTSTGPSTTVVADESPSPDTTAASGCASSEACDDPAPFCVDDECVPCSLVPDPSAACQSLDPTRPLCVKDRCVACTEDDTTACEGSTPACDVSSGTCVECRFHEQCPMSACHIEEGTCLPEDRVWYVDGDSLTCVAANGTQALPYCSVSAALINVGPGETGTFMVHARDGDASYTGGFTIDGDRVVAVRGAGGERPRFSGGGGVGAPVTIAGDAVAYLDHGRVDSSALVEAVQVVGAVLHIDRFIVALNQGGGISLSNGATLSARNTVLGANGSALADAQALRATDSGFSLRYVTIAGNDSAGVASIACTGASPGSLGNSIVVGIDPDSIDCRGLLAEHSALDTALDGDGVVLLDGFDADWFLAPGMGDFRLAPDHPFDDVAQWQVGDPLVDLDGDERPAVAGSPDVAGADR